MNSRIKYFITCVSFFTMILNTQAQRFMFDATWIFGYPEAAPHPMIGGTMMKFDRSKTVFDTFYLLTYPAQRTVFSDSLGNLRFYSGGCNVINREHGVMDNGAAINLGTIHDSYCPRYPLTQGILAVPSHDDELKMHLLYLNMDRLTFAPGRLFLADVDFSINPLGTVSFYDSLLIEYQMSDFLTATKHANGTDWWIIIPKLESNGYYTSLFTKDGLIEYPIQYLGHAWSKRDWSGQSVFSPDGSKYVRSNPYNGTDIFDFDRCSGMLSNPIHLDFLEQDSVSSSGVAISPNNQFLYVSASRYVFQYDLYADHIPSSKEIVAVYDGFVSPFSTRFYQQKLGPDRKIYISTPAGTNALHVIHQPDQKGLACDLRQHDMLLPTYNAFQMPNMPHYRLGPLDGSPCDTSGRDNIPQAYFHYRQDTSDQQMITFRNLSYFNPESYHWDFGDGTTSSAAHPIHSFSTPGIYEVCLTALNAFGRTTDCVEVTLDMSTSTSQAFSSKTGFQVFPNPTQDGSFTVQWETGVGFHSILVLNMMGEMIRQKNVTGQLSATFQTLHPGMYCVQAIQQGVRTDVIRVIVM